MITYYSENGCWGIEGVDLTKLNDSKVYGALFKLHKYEKTGLEPEQVIEMDELYREKCEEVNRLKKLPEHCEGHMPTHNMNFGQALMMLKEGKKVARSGWNGKGMYIYLVQGSTVDKENLRNEASRILPDDDMAMHGTGVAQFLPHIDMRTAYGDICVGWLASQTDMLAEDWEVV